MYNTNWATICAAAAIGAAPLSLPAAAANTRPTGNLIVVLTTPATPRVVREMRRNLTILRVSPSGAYLLVRPRKGQSIATIEKLSPRIAYVDREVVMGLETCKAE